jgi:hypothetical protein
MGTSRSPLILALLIITVGIGWLLSSLGIAPHIDWIWTLALGIVGLLVFVVSGGIDKLSIVIGPFFLISSVLSILRQTGRLTVNIEVPLLVIVTGVLLLVAQWKRIPMPRWFDKMPLRDE